MRTLAPPLTARRVPSRALLISVAALAVPVSVILLLPNGPVEHGPLLWLLALVPAFLLAYYRGWYGVAVALAAGMATLAVTEVAAQLLGRGVQDWRLFLSVAAYYLGITLGIGFLTEYLNRDRKEAERLALTDDLTQLPNRRHGLMVLEQEFEAATRQERPVCVVLFDVDQFKKFNDTNGHAEGDAALKTLAEVLRRTTRRMNLCARIGGEEFLAILSETDEYGASIYADRIREALSTSEFAVGRITVSAGIAAYRPDMRRPEDLLRRADDALYKAKRAGRDQLAVYQDQDEAISRAS